MNYGIRLQTALDKKGSNASKLANALGLSRQAIYQVIKGETASLTALNTSKAAEFLGISPDWLASGKGKMELPLHKVFPQQTVPLISWQGAKDWERTIDSLLPHEAEQILVTCPVRQHTYALLVDDDSNQPKFPAGCWVVVEPEETPINQKWCVVDDGGEAACLKQLVINGSCSYLRNDNPRYPIKEMSATDRFCGTVKQLIMSI